MADGEKQGPEVTRPARDFNTVVRIGIKKAPLRDLYYNLLDARWRAVLGTFVLGYLVLNAFFALLYVLGGDCIESARPGSFVDAYYFSVQTISTIGYGYLSPKTDYAEAIVTLESLVGLLGVAVMTGIMFTKFARPEARVMFTDKVVIARFHDQPHLIFRVANARGNDIVEASIMGAALLPEVSPEGHTMRRLHDLEFTRSRTPVFALSWLVSHAIDENSPLHGMTEEDVRESGLVLIISMTGLDGTFHQSVHARQLYRSESVVFDHSFVDIISELPDGRLQFDYGKFNEIKPDTVRHDGSPADAE